MGNKEGNKEVKERIDSESLERVSGGGDKSWEDEVVDAVSGNVEVTGHGSHAKKESGQLSRNKNNI